MPGTAEGGEPLGEAAVVAESVRTEKLKTETGRVLVADDNSDMRRYLTRLLKQHWTVEAVRDGTAALAAARARPPDLMLTDIMMPGRDGFELLRALRADERTSRIPVVMLSARAGEEARLEGLQGGADEYLVKPFSARELIARVNSQLALARHARERESLLERAQLARQEAELQKQAAESANRAKDEFLAMLGHELRNPLALDGFELAGRLRAMAGLERLRLIALTGYGQVADLQRTRAAGFDLHFVKPVDIEALEAALAADLER